MKESKLAEILRTFTHEEIKSFEKFIISPFFASKRDVKGFYSHFKCYYPDFNISMEDLFAKIFPGETYSEKKVRNLGSDLVKLAEEFIAYNSLRNDETGRRKLIASHYQKSNHDKLFLKALKELEAVRTNVLLNSNDILKYEEEIELLRSAHYLAKNEFERLSVSLAKHSDHFITSFLVRYFNRFREKTILFKGYRLKVESELFESVSESIDLDKMIRFLEERNAEGIWIIKMYYYSYKVTSDPRDYTSYRKLKEVFYDNIEKLSRGEKYSLFNHLISFAALNQKNIIELPKTEEFDVYCDMLKHEAFSPSESIPMNDVLYRNIVLITSLSNKTDFLENFIEEYSGYLKEDQKENTVNLAKAFLYYSKNEFETSLGHIAKVQYENFIFKLDIKHLMLKLYYEMDLYDQGFSLVDSYKHYLASSKDTPEWVKQMHITFTNYYNLLLKMKTNGNLKEMDRFMIDIEKEKELPARGWLKQKANELIKKGAN